MACGVAEAAAKTFADNAHGGLADTCTGLSGEFLLSEEHKLCY